MMSFCKFIYIFLHYFIHKLAQWKHDIQILISMLNVILLENITELISVIYGVVAAHAACGVLSLRKQARVASVRDRLPNEPGETGTE